MASNSLAKGRECYSRWEGKQSNLSADTVPDTGFSQDLAGSGGAQFPLHNKYGSVGDANGGRKLMSLLPGSSPPASQKKSQTTWENLFSGLASSVPTSAEPVRRPDASSILKVRSSI